MDFIQYILNETAWLYTKIYQNNFLFLDLWSIVHFWSGLVLYLILRAFRVRHPYLVLLAILFLYELAEILFIFFAFNVFRPETIKDQLTDILVGITGGWIAAGYLYLSKKSYSRYKYLVLSFMMVLAASTYAFPWVGFYHYHYEIPQLNTGAGINLYVFGGWTLAGFLILTVFFLLRKLSLLARILIIWPTYFICLIIFEYFTYYILGVHENSYELATPLIFGLIHGSLTMHIFYMICPFIFMGFYGIGSWLFNRAVMLREENVQKEVMQEALI